MATRINKRQSDQSKAAIKTTMLVKALQDCALGHNEMNANQIKAAQILLKFQLPELKAVEFTGEMDHEIKIKWK